MEKLRKFHEEYIQIQVRLLEAGSDLDALKSRNADQQQQLERKNEEVKQAMVQMREASQRGKQLWKQAIRATERCRQEADSAELLQEFKDTGLEQLEADIDSEKARYDMIRGANNDIIKEFEERQKQIEKLESKMSEFHSKLADYDHAINEIRGKWEPKLDALVKRISDAFSDSFARIGCAGQVNLDKAEEEPGADGQSGGTDFDQWSIQIQVKFREHENLSILDSHRQSGGERAVSTIFYLMALQSLSASPFRVVDEINQGMDPRNERMVHGRLVDIACATGSGSGDGSVGGSGGSQYFLITPKLLTGLTYKPGMKVLCIVSGEHMPKDYERIDFMRAVRTMRELGGRRSVANGVAQSNGRVDVSA